MRQRTKDAKATKKAGDIFLQRAIDCLKTGMSQVSVVDILIKEKRKLGLPVSKITAKAIVNKAVLEIKGEFSAVREDVIAVHVKRYDLEISNILTKDYDAIDFRSYSQRTLTEINDLFDCLDSMYAKEKLLQMHSKSFQIKINNKLNTTVVKKEIYYNLSNLTLEEKIEFLGLLQKTKKGYTEVNTVQLSKVNEENTIDIEHEVISNQNIEQIQHKKIEQSSSSPNGETLLDIYTKMQRALEQKAQQEYKRKGSKNVQ